MLKKILELIRFSHTLFALPFAMLGGAMALKLNAWTLRWQDVAGFFLCMVFARSAAMSFNRIADRTIDAKNPRTASRHLPSGALSLASVWIFTFVCSVGFIASTLFFLPNRIPIYASLPVLLFLLTYSFAKRWTVASHFWLGASLMLAPIAAWAALRPEVSPFPSAILPPVLLGLAVFFWSSSFDLIYATQDAEFDRQAGLFSVPGRFGITAAFRLAAVCQFLAVLLFASLPLFYPPFRVIFSSGVGIAAVILIAEHWIAAPRKNRPLDLTRINIAFFYLNVIISVGLFACGLIDIF